MLYFLGLHTIIDRLYGAYDACLLIAGGWAGAMPYWFGTRTRNCVSRSRACPNPRLTNTPDNIYRDARTGITRRVGKGFTHWR